MKTRILSVCFLLVLTLALIASFVRAGEMFSVQTATNSFRESVTVWQEKVGCGSEIFAQRYDSQGNPLGQELWVSEKSGWKDNEKPMVDISDSGGFVIAWRCGITLWVPGWPFERDVYARLYDPSINPVTDTFRVSYTKEKAYEAEAAGLAMLPSGKFIICWLQYMMVPYVDVGWKLEDIYIWFQQFGPDGRPLSEAYCITDPPLDFEPRRLMGIIRGITVAEETITITYRDNNNQSKVVVSEWSPGVNPIIKAGYRQESNPGDIVLTISPATPGKSYQVYYSNELSPEGNWFPLGELVKAGGTRVEVIDSSLQEGIKSRFYKAEILP